MIKAEVQRLVPGVKVYTHELKRQEAEERGMEQAPAPSDSVATGSAKGGRLQPSDTDFD